MVRRIYHERQRAPIPVNFAGEKAVESNKARQQTEENYRFLRYHDNLTNLVNRQEFDGRIERAL